MATSWNWFSTIIFALPAAAGRLAPQQTIKFKTIYGEPWVTQLREYCDPQYQDYLNRINPPGYPRNCQSCYLAPLVDCLYKSLDEVNQAEFASAAVTLGLMPTILALAGPNPVELGLLSLKRPLLTLLLAASSPATSVIRIYEYRTPICEILGSSSRRTASTDELPAGRIETRFPAIVSLLQYLVAFAALANVAQVFYLFIVGVYFTYNPDTAYPPIIYICGTLTIHIFGAAAVWLRVYIPQPSTVRRTLQQEFFPCASMSHMNLTFRRESYSFILLAWLSSSCSICIIVYGTFLFSSVLFLEFNPALNLFGRLLGSAIACRIVLVYELRGLKRVTTVLDEE